MVSKKILCRERLRRVPEHFSWGDHRLVRDEYIRRASPEALALYLLRVTGADAEGLSYYADGTAARWLSLTPGAVLNARQELVAADLIAYERPLYQVLALEPKGGAHDQL